MAHKNKSFALAFLSLFCFSSCYSSVDQNSNAQLLQLLTGLGQPQPKGFRDTLEKMVCNAIAQTASGLLNKGAVVAAQEFCAMISRIKTTLENDSPLTIEEIAAINMDLYTCLKDYFSYSPKDENKQQRASNIQHELKEKELVSEGPLEQKNNKIKLTKKDIEDLTEDAYQLFQNAEPQDWNSHRYNIISVLGTYIIEISKAKETWIRKIAQQENFSALTMIWYSAKNSEKAKKKYCALVPRFKRIEDSMLKLLELVLLSDSSRDLVTRASDVKKYFNLVSEDLEMHAKLQGPLELAKLQAINFKFLKAGDLHEPMNILAEQLRNAQ